MNIDLELNKLMPSGSLNEAEVKEAPQIKGYFGFIGLKYMRRVREIKKLCVDYIKP